MVQRQRSPGWRGGAGVQAESRFRAWLRHGGTIGALKGRGWHKLQGSYVFSSV